MRIFTPKQRLQSHPQNQRFSWFIPWIFGAILTTTGSAQAAERVKLGIDAIEFGVSVAELADYADKDRIGKELAPFLNSIEEKDRQYVSQFLKFKSKFSSLQVAQFFHSAIGKKILLSLGDLVQANPNRNGAQELLTGLTLAAADPQGLSLLTFLRKYPAPTLRLNLNKGFEVANKIEKLAQETKIAIAGVERLSSTLAASEPEIVLTDLQNLANPGKYPVKLQTETLKDVRRDRQFVVDFYLPQGLSQPAPVIIFSHGLASDRQHFTATARHLASHGFVAVTVEHPGSNLQKLKQLLKGSTKEMFDVSEFIDRPQDVSYILDDLGRRFPGIVNVRQAGVVGHSLGGYTALALGGATIDFDYLTQACRSDIDAVNASLLLQCEALKLPPQAYNFRDDRVKFALAVNPIDGSIFGPKGMAKIQIPVAIAAASDDVVASAVLEQIKPFSWIVNPERYLFVVRGVGHVADVRSFIRAFMPSLESFIPDPNIEPLKEYSRIFVLALVQTHVANQSNYRPYLQAGYATAISQQPNQVSILRSLTPTQFDNILRQSADSKSFVK
jgi:predicted dienelactone hydrolase